MSKDNRKDFSLSQLDYTLISLMSDKVKIAVIGAGKAGFIKAKTFSNSGCRVWVIAKEFDDRFDKLNHLDNVTLIKEEYHKKYILDKHIIVIASDNELLNKIIAKDCDELCKIFIDSSNSKGGNCITPCQRDTNSIKFALHTKGGSPKTSVYLAQKIKNQLENYDEYIDFVCKLRKRIKKLKCKNEIMEFVSSNDFYFFYKQGKHEVILNMFYGGSEFETKDCNKKK